jgi:hypothetical protein
MKYLLLGSLLLSSMVHSEIIARGGRYYFEIDGVRVSKEEVGEVTDLYKLTNHTALVAAVNKATECECEVEIVTPSIYVNVIEQVVIDDVVNNTVKFSWDDPKFRMDGTALALNEIKHYILTLYQGGGSTEYVVTGNEHIQSHLLLGTYEADIRTVDMDLLESNPSERITVIL